ncbi:MAG: hypothetical protein U1A23_03445, partial [Candidatus Sungbacteria bacterium]|nr:hypothetical protein [Candidatus Sungbacteria bacterium]
MFFGGKNQLKYLKAGKYNVDDIVKKVGRSKTTVLRWEKEGKIPEATRDELGWRYWTQNDFESIIKTVETRYLNANPEKKEVQAIKLVLPAGNYNPLLKFGRILKKLWFISLILSFILFPASDSNALSGAPAIISYQGRLSNASGDLLGGGGTTYYFKFSIWDNATVGSGNKLWPLTVPATTTATVRQGVFNVNIGDVANGYPDLLNFDFNTSSDIYLQVEVSSDNNSSQTLSPRQRISASAFSRLASAVSGSTTPSSFGTTTPIGNSAVTIEATSTNAILLSMRAALGQIANIFQIQNSSGSNLFYSNATGGLFASSTFQVTGATTLYGNIGVATTTPGKLFSVQGNGLFSGDLSLANFTATGTTRFNGNTYTWPSSIVAGNFLQTDSGGNLTWASASGGGTDGNWSFISTDGGYIRLATTTNLVGVGTSTPYAKLSVNSVSAATTTLALAPVTNQTANIIDIYNTSGALTSVFTAANFLGISTTSPATNLSVQGNALISGTLVAGNLTATNTTAGQPLIGNGSSAITSSSTLTVNVGGTGSTTLGGILAGNGTGAISSAIINSPLAFTLAGGLTCTNCLNTATANGPLAITSSGSSYIFNASSSPFFGNLTASSTIIFSSLVSGQINSNGGLLYSGATTTFNSPLTYSAGAVSCANCLSTATAVNNNTGFADLSISNSGSAYTFTLSATTSPTFGTITATSSIAAATSTPFVLSNLSSATNTAVRLSFRTLDLTGAATT